MYMSYIAVDLGSTNVKVAVYDEALKMKKWYSEPVSYVRQNGFCEFDADAYVDNILSMIHQHVKAGTVSADNVSRIVLTGQAESLVVLDDKKEPLMPAISWMDERSIQECAYIESKFTPEECYKKTGQPAVLPTWPATKALWIKRNKPEIHEKIAYYTLLKDYVVYRLTGKLMSDCSIATFTFYFDIKNKCYWKDMCEVCGIDENKLPPLAEPCTDAGSLCKASSVASGLTENTIVNIGTLDHFAGMVGVGNVEEGSMSLSTGTVMAIATMAHLPLTGRETMALHYGFIKDTYIFLPVSESGAASLEWYKSNFADDLSYSEMDRLIAEKDLPNELVFLPYLVGTNAPEYDIEASGLFYGLRSKHDKMDLAYAIMEGVSMMLAKNVERIRESGVSISRIIATGGGAKSELWCQMQADATGLTIEIPAEKEAACLGAAMIGAVSDGSFESYKQVTDAVVRMTKSFKPRKNETLLRKRRQFNLLYDAMLSAAKLS